MSGSACPDIVLSLENITKTYPGVRALHNVSLSFRRGEVHAIVGENGAGKSTLIKTITGNIKPDPGGVVRIRDKVFRDGVTPKESRAAGVEAIYQEMNLVDCLTAAENICLGRKFGRLVNQQAMNQTAQEIFDRFGMDIDPRVTVSALSSGKRQIVEIAKALSKDPQILIMDEPTASLSNAEIETLMSIIGELKNGGVTIIYISHRLDEIFRIADRVSVFRDGEYIATRQMDETDRAELIRLMVGRTLSEVYPQRKTAPGEVVLELENLTGNGTKNISFRLREGEILGLAGLVGAGRSEIMKVLYGVRKKQWGHIYLHGKEIHIRNPGDALRFKIGLVPEDRKREGCILLRSIRDNICFCCIPNVCDGIVVNRKRMESVAERYSSALRVKTPSLDQQVLALSGGNQQKVVISKMLAAQADILIFDEPTRGIDVGTKHEIYRLMNDLCAEGKSFILVSSDMEELLGMSDRIIVFHEKEMAGEIRREDFNQELILAMASGLVKTEV